MNAISNIELSVIVKQTVDKFVANGDTFSAMVITESIKKKLPSVDVRYSRVKPIVHSYMDDKHFGEYNKTTEFRAINNSRPVNDPCKATVMSAKTNKPVVQKAKSPIKIVLPLAQYTGKIDKNGGLHIRASIVCDAGGGPDSHAEYKKTNNNIEISFGRFLHNTPTVRSDGRLSIPCGKQNAGKTVVVKAYPKKIVIEGV